MIGVYTISLNGLRFFAEHGLYPEEQKVGHEFELDICITAPEPEGGVQHLDQTINYAEVFVIIQNIFNGRRPLLEQLASEIVGAIHKKFPHSNKVSVSIRKLSPPITNFSGSVAVAFSKDFPPA